MCLRGGGEWWGRGRTIVCVLRGTGLVIVDVLDGDVEALFSTHRCVLCRVRADTAGAAFFLNTPQRQQRREDDAIETGLFSVKIVRIEQESKKVLTLQKMSLFFFLLDFFPKQAKLLKKDKTPSSPSGSSSPLITRVIIQSRRKLPICCLSLVHCQTSRWMPLFF